MSYNYLPLDHTPTSFQQIKNLLAYQQLVFITFGGYEAIAKQRTIIDENPVSAEPNAAELLQSYGKGSGEKIPAVIVKLMLALKVKSLSLGKSGIKNETVQRLMDMHNNDVIPVIYAHGLALGQLSLPLIGGGEVTYQNKTYEGGELAILMGWNPLELKTEEAFALLTGNQYIAAFGLYILIKTEQLLQRVAAIIGYPANYFQAAKDAFEHVLAIFIKAVNNDSEKIELGEKQLNYQGYELALPLDFLTIAIAGLTNGFVTSANSKSPQKVATENILDEVNALSMPASINLLPTEHAGIKCLRVIENAIEIIKK